MRTLCILCFMLLSFTAQAGKIGACATFPVNNVWNTPIDHLSVHSRSTAWVNAIGNQKGVHADFGSGQWEGGPIGIPYNIVMGSSTAKSAVVFAKPSESDAGPYPIPSNYKIEYQGDRHLLVVDTENCYLYELFDAAYASRWNAYSGAIWNMNSNQLRPADWTAADASGLPIFAGLLRYDEVASGLIDHAIRFTIPTSSGYVWPARHLTSGSKDVLTNTPPFGARFRLKASYDISPFEPELQVILRAMQTYGIISADHGSGWYISGEPDERWNNQILAKLGTLKGSDFEAVDTACMMINPDSAQADPTQCSGVVFLTLGINPAVTTTLGNSVTLIATVTGNVTLSGTVAFKQNGTVITGCEAKALSNNSASCVLASPSVNVYTFSAVYNANSVVSSSANVSFSVTVEKAIRNSIAGLYITYFNRAPDKAGLGYWEAQALANGDVKALNDISSAFAQNAVAVTNYPSSMTNDQFLTKLYSYALNRLPDASGNAYWQRRLAEGVSRSNLMVEFVNAVLYYDVSQDNTSSAAEKQAALDAQAMVQNKVDAGLFFAINPLGPDDKSNVPLDANGNPNTQSAQYLASQEVMSQVTKDPITLEASYVKSKSYKVTLP